MVAALTLLIWNENPEEIKLYLIPDHLAREYREFLTEAHDRMINGDLEMNDGLRFLNAALCNEDVQEKRFEQYRGVLMQYEYKYTANPITGTNITAVYQSGMML